MDRLVSNLASILVALTFLFAMPAPALDTQAPENLVNSYAPLVERAAPAVVNIYARQIVHSKSPSRLLDGSAFWRLFRDTLLFGYGQDRIANSLGSGVIVGADGVIVTNRHVVADAKGVVVAVTDGRTYQAETLLLEPRADIAVLRIRPEAPLPVLAFGDSDALRVGDRVLAIGNPFGLGQTVTSGIVSATARTTFGIGDIRYFIQTDAAINPGNSGGAQIDLNGHLIGINTAIYSGSGGSQGLGFAVPSNIVRRIVESAVAGTPLVYPWIGISGTPVTPNLARALGLPGVRGVLVLEAHPQGPAAAAGFMPGDVILAVDGTAVNDSQALRYRVAMRRPGDTVRLSAMRAGKSYEIAVTTVAPPEVPSSDERKLTGLSPLRGATIASLSPALAEKIGADSGISGVVVLSVVRGSAAAQLGLAAGDIIRVIDSRNVETAQDVASFPIYPFRPWQMIVTRASSNLAIVQRAPRGFARRASQG